MFDRVEAFVRDVRALKTEEELAGAIDDVAHDLGYRYFALTCHVDVGKTCAAIRIHNYPDGWARWLDDQGLGNTDPVHRASHMPSVGFHWASLDDLIALTIRDREVLAAARREGIGDGFTVPPSARLPADSVRARAAPFR